MLGTLTVVQSIGTKILNQVPVLKAIPYLLDIELQFVSFLLALIGIDAQDFLFDTPEKMEKTTELAVETFLSPNEKVVTPGVEKLKEDNYKFLYSKAKEKLKESEVKDIVQEELKKEKRSMEKVILKKLNEIKKRTL